MHIRCCVSSEKITFAVDFFSSIFLITRLFVSPLFQCGREKILEHNPSFDTNIYIWMKMTTSRQLKRCWTLHSNTDIDPYNTVCEWYFIVPTLRDSGSRTLKLIRLSVTKTLTWLTSFEILKITHWYLALMILVTSPFNWHHALTFDLPPRSKLLPGAGTTILRIYE